MSSKIYRTDTVKQELVFLIWISKGCQPDSEARILEKYHTNNIYDVKAMVEQNFRTIQGSVRKLENLAFKLTLMN